jgi:single-strand DNA-binding protein
VTLNKMMIIGNLGADPELRYTPSGKAVANLRVAVNDRVRNAAGEWTDDTQWFNVEVWDDAAERAAERMRKGNKVFAEGQLRAREWEGKDGQKRTSLEIRFARVVSLERREPGEGGSFSVGSSEGAMDAPPAARPRGAAAASSGASEVEAIDVDDIPF